MAARVLREVQHGVGLAIEFEGVDTGVGEGYCSVGHGGPDLRFEFAVTEGRLDFGPWEQVFYGEFDGRRRKRVLLKIIGE